MLNALSKAVATVATAFVLLFAGPACAQQALTEYGIRYLPQATKPSNCIAGRTCSWADTTATPKFRFWDGTNNNTVAACVPTTNGDVCAWNGTNFVRSAGAGGTVYNQTIEDEGGALTQRTNLNFTGAGVSCADSGGKTVCTISGGGSSTLATAYTNGASQADNTITLDLTHLGVRIRNRSGDPAASIFEIQDNAGATDFLNVTKNGVDLMNAMSVNATSITMAPAVSSAGAVTALTVTGAANTNQTASTEVIDVNWNLARTLQHATGALATQRAMVVQAPTYSFVGASVITNAATLAITGPPIAGTNATLTSAYPLWIQSGVAAFDGGAKLTGSVTGTYNIAGTPTATSPILASLGATTISSPWTALTYSNSWVDYGGAYAASGWRKDANATVHVRIHAKSGTPSTAIGTLPAGSRPASSLLLTGAINDSGSLGFFTVTSAGVITPSEANTTGKFFYFSFPAEN